MSPTVLDNYRDKIINKKTAIETSKSFSNFIFTSFASCLELFFRTVVIVGNFFFWGRGGEGNRDLQNFSDAMVS